MTVNKLRFDSTVCFSLFSAQIKNMRDRVSTVYIEDKYLRDYNINSFFGNSPTNIIDVFFKNKQEFESNLADYKYLGDNVYEVNYLKNIGLHKYLFNMIKHQETIIKHFIPNHNIKIEDCKSFSVPVASNNYIVNFQ
jgi:hypothetical protein